MAISTGTVKRAYGFEELRDASYTDTSEYEVVTCKVDVEFSTVAYATGDDATFAPATVIASTLRDGKTPTIIAAAVVAGGQFTLSAAPTTQVYVGATSASVSSGTVTVQLSGEDWSTELTNGTDLSTSTWSVPLTYQVTFKRLRG